MAYTQTYTLHASLPRINHCFFEIPFYLVHGPCDTLDLGIHGKNLQKFSLFFLPSDPTELWAVTDPNQLKYSGRMYANFLRSSSV